MPLPGGGHPLPVPPPRGDMRWFVEPELEHRQVRLPVDSRFTLLNLI